MRIPLSVAVRRVVRVRTQRTIVESPDLVVRSVACADDHTCWSVPETSSATGIVLVRQGRFRLDAQGRQATVDPTVGYLQRPGEEMRFAHPAGGDVCTFVTLTGDWPAELAEVAGLPGSSGPAGRSTAPCSPLVRVDARLELAHRLLVRTGTDPHFAAVEGVLTLLELALRDQPADDPAPGRRELAERAREALLSGEPDSGTGLVALARLLGTSPAHLSRTFRHHVGMPLSRYRNRLRVSRALSRMAEGDTDLAALAVGLGFSDQAHMARVIRAELGHPPARVRSLLTPS